MNHRDLMLALFYAGKAEIRKIDAALTDEHRMTRLAFELENLMDKFRARQLEGQEHTDECDMVIDPQLKECFVTAISEQADYLFEYSQNPLHLWDAMSQVIRVECKEQTDNGWGESCF